MQIISPTAADARVIALIHVESWRAAYAGLLPPDYLASLSVDDREQMWSACIAAGMPPLLVAKTGERVVGWINFAASRDEDADAIEAEIWALYVAQSSWATGVGRALWLAARERLLAQGFRSCGLWVFAQNARAIKFYESMGFVRDSSPPKSFELGGRFLQEVRYRCRLRD